MSLIGTIRDALTGLTASVEARTGTPTGNALNVQIGPGDPIGNIPVFVDSPHHHLHEGEMHQYTYAPAAISNAATLNHRMVVPTLTATTRTPHIEIEVDCTGEAWVYLYEAPTTSANGTLQTVYNKNRNSATTPGSTIYLAPTVTTPGTMVSAWIVGSGQKAGGQSRESIEWDLKSNTVYLIQVVSKNASNICMRFIWYEDLGV